MVRKASRDRKVKYRYRFVLCPQEVNYDWVAANWAAPTTKTSRHRLIPLA
jgi:hypothetical protein